MNKWDKRFLDLAGLVATWSKDSTQVGAVIVDNKNRVVSLGFNGYPRAVTDHVLDRDRKLMRTLHAEVNALNFAGRSVEGCTVYVTHHPCAQCTAQLIQSGVTRIVIPDGSDEGFSERWESNIKEAKLMLAEAQIPLVSPSFPVSSGERPWTALSAAESRLPEPCQDNHQQVREVQTWRIEDEKPETHFIYEA
jgi:dCMP deaminase